MVLRIEYLLVLALLLLGLSIVGINPTSQPAIHPIEDREILFQDFSLIEMKEEIVGQKVFAKETIKYKHYIAFKDINFTDEDGNNICAMEGLYKDKNLSIKKNISVKEKDGLSFIAENLNYNLKTKKLQTSTPFTLDINGSHIQGENLKFHMANKEISADKIIARIFY